MQTYTIVQCTGRGHFNIRKIKATSQEAAMRFVDGESRKMTPLEIAADKARKR